MWSCRQADDEEEEELMLSTEEKEVQPKYLFILMMTKVLYLR